MSLAICGMKKDLLFLSPNPAEPTKFKKKNDELSNVILYFGKPNAKINFFQSNFNL